MRLKFFDYFYQEICARGGLNGAAHGGENFAPGVCVELGMYVHVCMSICLSVCLSVCLERRDNFGKGQDVKIAVPCFLVLFFVLSVVRANSCVDHVCGKVLTSIGLISLSCAGI